MERREVTTAVAAQLLAAQFPGWGELPLAPVDLAGWDNTTFRLGEELLVRLPNADAYVAQVDKEHRWLPALGPRLPLQIPEPVALGRPDDHFPRPWSIYRWIDGTPASVARITDIGELASDLAAFLSALYSIDATGGPPPGRHNFFRGGPLHAYDAQVRATIRHLGGQIDNGAAEELWDAALASTWDVPPVWVHGDVAPSNLIVSDGRLRAVIDFGDAAVGDPACDLVVAWTFLEADGREAFKARLPLDAAAWARGRGWALWKALVTMAEGGGRGAAPRRFGWRTDARGVIDAVVAEHLALTR